MEKTEKNWGGSRAGAGRKTQSTGPLVTIGLSVEVDTKEKLMRLAKAEGMSASAYINKLIKGL